VTPSWAPDVASFTFAVTEITSDLVISLMERDCDQPQGELVVPLPQLLREQRARRAQGSGLLRPAGPLPADWADAASRWSDLVPPRRPGEALLRPWPMPQPGLGKVWFSAALEMDTSLAYAYLAPEVLPPEAPSGVDSSLDFSFAAVYSSLGRTLDCIFFPAFANMRTLLYLQSWEAPRLNCALLCALLVGTRPACWFAFRCAAPLWLLMLPFLNGYVSRLIHARDPTVLTLEEQAAVEKAAADAYAYECEHWDMVKAATARMMAADAKQDPSLAAHILSYIPGSAVVGALGRIATSTVSTVTDSASQLNVYKKVLAKVEKAHVKLVWAADLLERAISLFTWSDPFLTAVLCLLAAAIGVAASLALALLATLLARLSVDWSHVTLLAGASCFLPALAPVTYNILVWVDYILSFTQTVGASHPLLAGSGFARVTPKAKPRLSGEVLRADAEAAAEQEVAARRRARERELKHRSILQPVTLDAAELARGAWLGRLLERAPNELRATHRLMAARTNTAQPPGRELLRSTSMRFKTCGRSSSI